MIDRNERQSGIINGYTIGMGIALIAIFGYIALQIGTHLISGG